MRTLTKTTESLYSNFQCQKLYSIGRCFISFISFQCIFISLQTVSSTLHSHIHILVEHSFWVFILWRILGSSYSTFSLEFTHFYGYIYLVSAAYLTISVLLQTSTPFLDSDYQERLILRIHTVNLKDFGFAHFQLTISSTVTLVVLKAEFLSICPQLLTRSHYLSLSSTLILSLLRQI